MFKLFQVIQIFFLPFHQHSHCRHPPPPLGQKHELFYCCSLLDVSLRPSSTVFHSIFIQIFLPLPLHQLRPSSTVFHSIFIQIFLPLPLHQLRPSRHHCRPTFPSFKHQRGQQALIHSLSLFPGQTAPFHLSTFEISHHQRGQQALIHGLTLSQAKQHHFISQLLKFPTTKGGNRL